MRAQKQDRVSRALLALRDHLELRQAYGDLSRAWLLPIVQAEVSEHARLVCLCACDESAA